MGWKRAYQHRRREGHRANPERIQRLWRRSNTLTGDADEQVLCLLLISSMLRDPKVRESLPEYTETITRFSDVTFPDYQKLEYLADSVPGVRKLITSTRLKAAFENPEGAERLRLSFARFRSNHATELGEAIALRPDLFESAIQRTHEMAPAIGM